MITISPPSGQRGFPYWVAWQSLWQQATRGQPSFPGYCFSSPRGPFTWGLTSTFSIGSPWRMTFDLALGPHWEAWAWCSFLCLSLSLKRCSSSQYFPVEALLCSLEDRKGDIDTFGVFSIKSLVSPLEFCALAKSEAVFACRHLSILIHFPCILTIQCRLFGEVPSPDFISYHL